MNDPRHGKIAQDSVRLCVIIPRLTHRLMLDEASSSGRSISSIVRDAIERRYPWHLNQRNT